LFVAIPLPLTGAWTGTIISYFLGIPFKVAFLAISVGVLLSAILVFSLTKTGILIEKSFGLSGLFLFLLALSLFLVFSQKNKKSYEK
jgi:Predicted membrane protein